MLFTDLAALGPFFAVARYEPSSEAAREWRPMSDLVDDPTVLADRIRQVRAALAIGSGRELTGIEPRVAASVTQLGLVARLVSPGLASAVLHGRLLDLRLSAARWQPGRSGIFPMMVAAAAPDGRDRAALAASFAREVIGGPIAQLTAAVRQACSISPLILWGNIASAVNGAASMVAAERPADASAALEFSRLVLAAPPLGVPDPAPGPGFRRRSCCLLYRAAAGGARARRAAVCTDCVLTGDRNRA